MSLMTAQMNRLPYWLHAVVFVLYWYTLDAVLWIAELYVRLRGVNAN